jgi:thiol:disulfide interchange protein DsbA
MPSWAQTVGKDYTLISPAQPTEDAGKIEVLEFFSYGCPHCADFNPLVTAWAAKLPGDVVFRKVPITFGRAAWANIAKLYYALKVTGDLDRLESDVFKAIHNDRINLFDEKSLLEWVAKKGVDQKKFAEAFNSFGVMSQVRRGDQMAQAYKIQGVPALAVDGKYLVGGKDFNEQLAIADKLIAKARSEKSGKK